MKKIDFLKFLPLLAMVVFFSCKEDGSIKIDSSISLDKNEVVLNPGGTVTLNAKLMQAIDGGRVSTSDDVSLTWTSSNDSIATVSYGVVTAVTGGEVEIIVSAANVDNVQEKRCKVVVRDVYVSGEYGNATERTACVWKNNKLLYSLASDVNAFANAMVVTDTKDVYVVGNVAGVGKVWKNGAEVASYGTALNAICVEAGDVYVAGTDNTTAKVWKNGAELYTAEDATFKSIAVSDNVYVGGYTSFEGGYENDSATIWKNGVAEILAKGAVNALLADGANLYAAGTDETYGKVWKNSQELYVFEKNTQATGITLADNKIYTCGFSGNTGKIIAKVWENGAQLVSTEVDKEYLGEFIVGKNEEGKDLWTYSDLNNDGKVKTSAVCVSLDDLYVSGYFDNKSSNAVYWKNGTSEKLERCKTNEVIMGSNFVGGNVRERATAIVVK